MSTKNKSKAKKITESDDTLFGTSSQLNGSTNKAPQNGKKKSDNVESKLEEMNIDDSKKDDNNNNKKNKDSKKDSKKDAKTDGKKDSKNNKTSADYYFDSYSHFGIHEEMIKDKIRTGTYYKAITQNPHLFKGKIVLDVGCGTGILSMFAAKAGAKKVYGIDMAGIAESAKKIIKENGFENKIEIIRGKAEDVKLPCKVDIIISEWMGYFLLYESMLNTVLYCRDKWLKKNGILMPDKAKIYLTAIEDGQYMNEKISFWDNIYGFKMSCLKHQAMTEPLVDIVHSNAILTDTCPILDLDLYKCTVADLSFEANFQLKVKADDYCHAFVAYFDIVFSKCHTRVGFSTSPWAQYTHWKQTVFYLDETLLVSKNTKIKGKIKVVPNKKNPRDLDIQIDTVYNNTKFGKTSQSRLYSMR